MLKISIVLVTTTAFAALLIAYPFSPHPAAQVVATAAPAEEPRPSTLQPDPAPVGIAGLLAGAAPVSQETDKTMPARTGRPRVDSSRTPDPRIPPRPSRPEREAAVPVAYPRTPSTSRTPYYLPPGATLVPRGSVGRLAVPPAYHSGRYRTVVLAPNQPVR